MTTPLEFADLSASLHDKYFHIERLVLQADQAELRLPIYAGRSRQGWLIETSRPPEEPPPPPVHLLVVRNVIDVSIEDEANIGWYDVNQLQYDPATEKLRLVSSAPCQVVVRCRTLDVELLRG